MEPKRRLDDPRPHLRLIAAGSDGLPVTTRAVSADADPQRAQREISRTLRRLHMPERIFAFASELNGATTAEAVHAATIAHVGRIAGAYTGLIFLADTETDGGMRLAAHPWLLDGPDVVLQLQPAAVQTSLLKAGPVLRGAAGVFNALAPLFLEFGAVSMVCTAMGPHGMLLLVERRSDRMFEEEDWQTILSLAHLVEIALERVSRFEKVHVASLTDPLTGLGNRRRLRVVLDHALAAGRRGQPVTVVMIDVDNFKVFNDVHGHVRGDEALRRFATGLQEQVRGSDLVVRYGGDEFLFVLTGADAANAQCMLERIRQAQSDELTFTAGVAAYDPTVISAEDLIERADQALYRSRAQQRSRTR